MLNKNTKAQYFTNTSMHFSIYLCFVLFLSVPQWCYRVSSSAAMLTHLFVVGGWMRG